MVYICNMRSKTPTPRTCNANRRAKNSGSTLARAPSIVDLSDISCRRAMDDQFPLLHRFDPSSRPGSAEPYGFVPTPPELRSALVGRQRREQI
jgi:hypothetical protein